MSNVKTIHIVVFGIGNIGSTLINQINEAKDFLYKQQNLKIKIPVVTNSRLAFFDEKGVDNVWNCDFETCSIPYKIEDVIAYVKRNKFENLIAVDATASKDFVQNYIALIQNGFHIVSANKTANTLHYEFYNILRNTLKKHDKSFLYETNVGAGLPVIETINNLHKSGEKISKIRGVFSGSLSYIFNTFSSEDMSFSTVLRKASNLGLTEPDAREDLSGNDVARKLLILARELDLKLELNDVSIDSLVPKYLNGKTTVSQFNKRLKELDEPFNDLKQNLSKNKVLRYVGELDVVSKTLEVKLITEEKHSVIGQLNGTDSVFEIYSQSYKNSPLVIRGAGAGKEVTARGLFSDVIKLSNQVH